MITSLDYHGRHRISIAVLITCHNRREMTMRSLRALYASHLPENMKLVVYVVDDGSTDGTGRAIKDAFPDTIVIDGDGSLYWTKGTAIAFDAAMQEGHDFYLWLNDDVFLYPYALETLIGTYWSLIDRGRSLSIVVGSMKDSRTGTVTYGGKVRASRWHPLRLATVEPQDVLKPCDAMNGNCVLIPLKVAERVGNVDPALRHRMADIDYGFRARGLGCELWVAPGFMGESSRNPVRGSWEDRDLPFRERWQKAMGPKGLPPRDYRILLKRVAGPWWPFFWTIPYAKLVLQSVTSRSKER